MNKATWICHFPLDFFFPQPFKKVKALSPVGCEKLSGGPDVGSSLPIPDLFQNKKQAMEPHTELILGIFLLKNVDFEFLICYSLFCPISHPGTLASPKLSLPGTLKCQREAWSKSSAFLCIMRIKGMVKTSQISIFFKKNNIPFALSTNDIHLSSTPENVRRFLNIS